MIAEQKPLFSPGRTVGTPSALEALAASGQSPSEFLNRHVMGDWGEICEDDKHLNDQALVDGERLLSVYRTNLGVRLYVITEYDRSVTTILLVEEY